MRIATWNINGVRARIDRLVDWLRTRAPDVVCLQETKCTDDQFPTLDVQAAGYAAHCFGQKAYNGVALLSKRPVTDVRRNLGDDDAQCRVISGAISGVTVVGLYAPNGQELESEAYRYKLGWYGALTRWLAFAKGTPTVVCGDFNVAPAELDVYDVPLWTGQTLFSPKERAAFEALKEANGLVDLFREKHPGVQAFSWWDYRELGFPKNKGLRIDHVLVSRDLLGRCTGVEIDREARKGKQPSDHAPVIATFAE
ncbi:MAG: exodeoxyribonuclease III [Myxococcaceae bacterium]|nr:exodeoxyribonuclease III [Myxococcaceae bacterium]MCA3012315.1 exodeoxyribonuclease III [Myxococcaceae bacterium]